MSYETFRDFNFKPATLALIEQANEIISDYAGQGYTLTLRQLYYQFVAKGLIENSNLSYKRLGSVVTDGRLAGLISWSSIEDNHRTSATGPYVQENEAEALSGIEYSLALDFWERQDCYIEVWVEKDALLSVVAKACREFDVPHMACKGYLSASEAWRAGKRFEEKAANGKRCVLIHLGDHDPSGIDMTRDNADRLKLFAPSADVDVRRIALNMQQVEQYAPPPNPAKITDSRATGYISRFGTKSWELDALAPSVIERLIRSELDLFIDREVWQEVENEQDERRKILAGLGDYWDEVRPHVARIIEENE